MQTQIAKSPPITAMARKQVTISHELHYLLMVEAAKRRLKVKDLMNHFVVTGLVALGVDVSEITPEEDHRPETGEAA